jgi:hypothetical protein
MYFLPCLGRDILALPVSCRSFPDIWRVMGASCNC